MAHALELVSGAFTGDVDWISWGQGTHTNRPGMLVAPDWAGFDPNEEFPAKNRVPGVSEVSGKWLWEQQKLAESVRSEFHRPIRQAVHYARLHNTRYAYVISDKDLVCVRRRVSEHGRSPLAGGRAPRGDHADPTTPIKSPGQCRQEPSTPSDPSPDSRVVTPARRSQPGSEPYLTPEHQTGRRISATSTASGLSAMSLDSSSIVSPRVGKSPSNYTDNGNSGVNEASVQVARIHWGETRPGRLTVNLALFWLHILAAFDIGLETSYSPLGQELAKEYGSCSSVRMLLSDFN